MRRLVVLASLAAAVVVAAAACHQPETPPVPPRPTNPTNARLADAPQRLDVIDASIVSDGAPALDAPFGFDVGAPLTAARGGARGR
ncbi:MAG TPA: hypothetical protein VE987_09895 [Polyangiaceae bacterium]|nr:hypothetical protein [Polyangiaceae bacterium]